MPGYWYGRRTSCVDQLTRFRLTAGPHARNTDHSSRIPPSLHTLGMVSVYSTLAVCEVLVASPLTAQSPLVAALECPNCRSTDLKRIFLVYAAGVHDTRGRFIASLPGSASGLFFGRYRGASQSRLSKIVAPPVRAPYFLPIVLWLFGFFVVIAFGSLGKLSSLMALISVGYNLLLPVYLIAALFYNWFVRPTKYRNWENTFLCQRCATRIEPYVARPSVAQTLSQFRP